MWTHHWMEATGDLSPWKDRVSADIDAARLAVAPFMDPGKIDILLERGEDAVRTDIGISAHVNRSNLITLVFDPYNDNFAASLRNGTIRRLMVNCAHKAARQAGPGYGFTLGGALVSEGLAAQFVRLVYASPPEPWEVLSDHALGAHWPDQRMMMSTKFDFSEWFLGNGDRPFGLGYALGCRIVEYWLTSGVSLNAERLVTVPTPKVLAAAPIRAMAG